MKVLVILVAVLGCSSQASPGRAPAPDEVDTPLSSVAYGRYRLVVVHDDKRAVTCWIAPGRDVSVSCLPDSVLVGVK